jgi:low affinity Fe/Cu permease
MIRRLRPSSLGTRLRGCREGEQKSHCAAVAELCNAGAVRSDAAAWAVSEGADMAASRRKPTGEEPHPSPQNDGLNALFGQIASRASHAAGRALTFIIAAAVIIVWAVTGPIFHYSDTWQLVINTGTTIVTFLMVFLIQNSQNRDGAAIQVKLDELIRVGAAHNSLVGIEHLTDDELDEIRNKCELRAKAAEKIGEAKARRTGKKTKRAAVLVTE